MSIIPGKKNTSHEFSKYVKTSATLPFDPTKMIFPEHKSRHLGMALILLTETALFPILLLGESSSKCQLTAGHIILSA